MEDKLEQLKAFVAKLFEDAADKNSIEAMAAINNQIAEVAAEQKQLVEETAELIKSYKDLVKHTSFKDEKTEPKDQVSLSTEPDLNSILEQFAKK